MWYNNTIEKVTEHIEVPINNQYVQEIEKIVERPIEHTKVETIPQIQEKIIEKETIVEVEADTTNFLTEAEFQELWDEMMSIQFAGMKMEFSHKNAFRDMINLKKKRIADGRIKVDTRKKIVG